MCIRGEKLVLFVTGFCGESCYYCPISAEKKGKDVVYANEWPEPNDEEIIKEARLCEAKGAGITGGDPLVTLEKTTRLIRLLKSEFGKSFHIHLYTPLTLVTPERLDALRDAGLDEIRFHPDLEKPDRWQKISLAQGSDWDVGIEIPAIPGKEKETRDLIRIASPFVKFFNLNELEYSDTNSQGLSKEGFVTKDDLSYGISGSERMAKGILEWATEQKIEKQFHYCTAKLKDGVQLARRIRKRAENVKAPYDYVTKEGILVRGAVYLSDTIPGSGYRDRMKEMGNRDAELSLLQELIRKEFPRIRSGIDSMKKRVLVPKNKISRINQAIPNTCAIVSEYPTYDLFEVEIEVLEKPNR